MADESGPYPIDRPLPPASQSTTMTITSIAPLQGVLEIVTAEGSLFVTLDRAGAGGLMNGLVKFLAVEPADFSTDEQQPN